MKNQNQTCEQISEHKFNECTKRESPLPEISNLFRVFRQTYPNLQYSCTRCGTFDITLDLSNPEFILAKCLDCKSKWMEEYVY